MPNMKWLHKIIERKYDDGARYGILFTLLFVTIGVIVLVVMLMIVKQNGARPSDVGNDSIINAVSSDVKRSDTSVCNFPGSLSAHVLSNKTVEDVILAVDNYQDIERMVLTIAKKDIFVKLWRVDEKSNDKWYMVYKVGRYDYLRTINVKNGIYGKLTRVVFENNGWFHVAGDKRKRYEMDMDTLRYYYRNELKASFPTSVIVHIPQPDFTCDEFEEYQEMIDVENCRDEYDDFESYDSYEDYLDDGGFE